MPAFAETGDLGGGRPVPAIVFPEGSSSAESVEVTWTEWFDVFEASGLEFVHPEGDPATSPPKFELRNR